MWPSARGLAELAYGAFWVTGHTVLRAYLPVRIEGPPPPRDGGLLIVANHLSYVDPVVLQAASHRRIQYLMTEDFYDIRGFRWFFRWLGALRVSTKQTNLSSLKEARATLKGGAVVGIFPEGKLSTDGTMGDAQAGAAVLAGLARVPILPIRLMGTYEVMHKGQFLPRSSPVTVRRGTLLPPPSPGRAGRRETTRRIVEALRNL
jgi:1-acyl-sn-glycerol-3-phosphate acyltransferase